MLTIYQYRSINFACKSIFYVGTVDRKVIKTKTVKNRSYYFKAKVFYSVNVLFYAWLNVVFTVPIDCFKCEYILII